MDNKIPNQLIEAIVDDKLIIFVGAGLSLSSGLPTWKKIVLDTLNSPNIEKGSAFIDALENGILSPLEVLDKIKEKNKRDVYINFEKAVSEKN